MRGDGTARAKRRQFSTSLSILLLWLPLRDYRQGLREGAEWYESGRWAGVADLGTERVGSRFLRGEVNGTHLELSRCDLDASPVWQRAAATDLVRCVGWCEIQVQMLDTIGLDSDPKPHRLTHLNAASVRLHLAAQAGEPIRSYLFLFL